MTLGPVARPRLEAVDLVRGIIMILMALDHVRDYFAYPGIAPTNLAAASAGLFLSHWITHICAPVFFLLTGTGAYLSLRRKAKRQLSIFLATRGLWLIFVETVVMRCFAYQFNFDYQLTLLVVLWALGWAMICLALLLHLPAAIVTLTGVLMIGGHNLLDGITSDSPLWSILHAPGFVLDNPAHTVFVVYPLVPWVGVTAVGYGLGTVYGWDAGRRRTFLLRTGLALTIAFVVLRWLNVYGDPRPWSRQATPFFTVLSFINATKLPPSLLFLLMTLGPAMLMLAAADRGTPAVLRPALVFGRVPLFYYMIHFALIHALAVLTCYVRYGTAHWMFESPDMESYPFTMPPGWGYSLPVIYLVWVVVVIAMYPLCRWFAALKQRRSDAWLSYV